MLKKLYLLKKQLSCHAEFISASKIEILKQVQNDIVLRRYKKLIFLTSVIFLLFPLIVFALPFAPTILTIEGQNVSGGQMAYTNKIINIQVTGNAESYKKIKLYKDGDYATSIGETISDPATGAWTASIPLSAGTHTVTAKASEVLYNGTLTNGPVWVAGKDGFGLQFDGINDYVSLGDPKGLQINGDITMEAWIKTTSGAAFQQIIVDSAAAGVDRNYEFRLDNGILAFFHGNGAIGTTYSSGTSVNDGNWKHVVFVADYPNYYFYVNGLQVSTGAMTFNITDPPAASTKCIGGHTWTEYFDGAIDEARIYKNALTPGEVAARYNNNPVATGLVAEWKFDEGAGITAYDTHATTDESSPSNVANVTIDTQAPTFYFYGNYTRGTGLGIRRSSWQVNSWNFLASDSPMAEWGNETNTAVAQWNSIVQFQIEWNNDLGGSGVDWPDSAKIIIDEIDGAGGNVITNLGGTTTIVDDKIARWTSNAGQYIWGNTARGGAQASIFVHGKMYRATFEIKDKAGNLAQYKKEWVCDNNPPPAGMGIDINDIDHFLLHQANQRITNAIAERLNIPAGKMISNIEIIDLLRY